MRVRVLFFGRLKDIVGLAEDQIDLAEGARLEDLFAGYGRRFPELAAFRASVVASVNQEYARWDTALRGGDEVAFLPPVSGGQSAPAPDALAEDIYELVRAPIASAAVIGHTKAPPDGAVVVFDGIVRDQSAGRRTLYLEYEAYEPMALKELRAIGEQLHRQFPVHRVVIVHRLGRLAIGETSVLIAVSAAHRDAAFDACRLAIETLKRAVPIWKKEYFADGSAWVEGELPALESRPSRASEEAHPTE